MDLRSVRPSLNLYNLRWPLRTAQYPVGPTKFTLNQEGRRGHALNSIVCEGCILTGAEVANSVLGQRVFVDNGATVTDSVVMENCYIGAGAKISKAIIDKNAHVPAGAQIGYDLDADRENYHVTGTGIVVVEGHRSAIRVSSLTI